MAHENGRKQSSGTQRPYFDRHYQKLPISGQIRSLVSVSIANRPNMVQIRALSSVTNAKKPFQAPRYFAVSTIGLSSATSRVLGLRPLIFAGMSVSVREPNRKSHRIVPVDMDAWLRM